ncbi:MAG: MBL fold metallo-hydrolase [Candidatus Thorarchaeota archaeon]|nr:MBL fold metallo-hydrolase [Candidatus Thorarchaeota archaeon]
MLDKVVARVYADTTGKYGGNFGAVVLDDQVVMIDSGMVHPHMTLVKEWVAKEFSLPITKLVYTHSHADHVLGAQGLGEASRIGSEPMQQICLMNMKDRWKKDTLLKGYEQRKEERPEIWNALQSIEIQLPDITFKDRLEIGIGDELQVRLLGGHTSGSSIVIVEPEHIVFIGDLIFNGVFPYIGDSSCNPDRWIMALQHVLEGDYTHIISGHGHVCTNTELEYQIEFFQSFRASVKEAINDGITHDQYFKDGHMPHLYDEGVEGRAPNATEFMFKFYS